MTISRGSHGRSPEPPAPALVLFTEPTFLFLFLPILLALYFISGSREHGAYGNWLLLVASVIFYAKGGGAFTWLMLGSIAFNYWMAIAVDRARDGADAGARPPAAVLAFAVAVNLVVLGVFKYANFFADNVNALLLALGVQPRRRAARAAADRHLVLHLPRHLLRRRRLSRATRRRRRARSTRRCTCCSFRSSSPGRSSATATSPTSSRAASSRSTTSPPASGGSSSASRRRC